MTKRKMVEIPYEKFDEDVIAHLQTLAAHFRCRQQDLVWNAILDYVAKYPLDELTRLKNPCDRENSEEDEPP